MQVLIQISLGSLILIFCTLFQIGVIGWIVKWLRSSETFRRRATVARGFRLAAIVLMPLLFAHTFHVYTWAFSVWLLGALPGYEEPIYFSLVTYATLGYGDVTLPKDFRIFGAMSAVNGILAFGLSTAFLVGLFSNLVESLRRE